MKKSTMGVTIALLILIVGIVATYAILTGKAKTETEESLMTAVQTALNRIYRPGAGSVVYAGQRTV